MREVFAKDHHHCQYQWFAVALTSFIETCTKHINESSKLLKMKTIYNNNGNCNAPTPRLKVLNKHYTHNVHRDGECYWYSDTDRGE